MLTKRMPSDSACARSQATGPLFPRRSTMVVTPSFFSSARPCAEGCAPRKSTSLTFPGYAGQFQFFRWCAERSAGCRRLRGSVGNNLRVRRARGREEQAHGQKSFAQAGKKEPVHHRLDALVYSARWMKTVAKGKRWARNMTTTNRHGTKTSTTFSVFLLTRI